WSSDVCSSDLARRLGPSRPEETAMRPVLPLLLVVALAACAPSNRPAETPPPPAGPANPATPSTAALNAAALAASHWRLTAATDAAGQRIDALLPDPARPLQLDFADGRVSVSGG